MKMHKLHHVSAIVGHPQETYDFYTQVLRLHLIKKTVNFDDPTTYHLYFGDQYAEKDFTMTFFNWEHIEKKGRVGSGQVRTIAFSIGNNSIEDWKNHLVSEGIDTDWTHRFDKKTLEFNDPHGLRIALVENETHSSPEIHGFYGVEILSGNVEASIEHLTDIFDLQASGENASHRYFETDSSYRHTIALSKETHRRGIDGIGTVHHLAWEAENTEGLKDWQQKIVKSGLQPTEITDRSYFESIYYREPGYTIYEIATAGPGFLIDEAKDELGMTLKLPPQYENSREEIEKNLSSIIID
ncbi:VOC family protein [Aerococcaceae bacterium DSM 111020]|nr:VOC family protein [Aerococcaceae bacterium DSM 111020]